LTGKRQSSLASLADEVLLTGAPKVIYPLGMTPTTSTTAMGVIGDILVALQMMRIGFTDRDYALRHHGGYLGAIVRSKLGIVQSDHGKISDPNGGAEFYKLRK
jgi:arabinose-5-phosphate isomerase